MADRERLAHLLSRVDDGIRRVTARSWANPLVVTDVLHRDEEADSERA